MNGVTEAQMKEFNRRFEDHLDEYRVHISEDVEKYARLDAMQEANMVAIADLTLATKGLVEGWIVANGLQRFLKWVSAFGIVGVALVWMITGKAPTDWLG